MGIESICQSRSGNRAKPVVAHRVGPRKGCKNGKILGRKAIHYRRGSRGAASVALIVAYKSGHIGLLSRRRWVGSEHLFHNILEIMARIDGQVSRAARFVIVWNEFPRPGPIS